MVKDFQDIQQLDSEENDHQLDRGPSPCQQFLQRLCSQPRLSLLSLSFNVLMLVVICVIGSKSTQLRNELQDLKESFNNFSSRTLVEVQAISFHGGNTSDRVTDMEEKLEKYKQDLKSDHDNLILHLKHFPTDLRILECQLEFLHSNGRGTKCCPINWLEHDGSCYWFSVSGTTWSEADKYCRLENAYLAVINSREEQKFILQHSSPFHTWIGLTNSGGSWTWVDGTNYEKGYLNWAFSQPDDWKGHEMGGSEDCVEIRSDGRWNDDFCEQVHRWVCETNRNHTVGA
ncbi:PREDICTED: asialoglycoprotein receptor 2-like [Elephantulus edwardii]|uniref:asialoglycoprotein receptor 2-like n=1 Tax=Elephantulus edwardii TaxID=28737 RepID=UPI0003F0A5D8|nr:PREDICTED: asialoglycoprotein receptor 2-like [Elephantulus edwardii]